MRQCVIYVLLAGLLVGCVLPGPPPIPSTADPQELPTQEETTTPTQSSTTAGPLYPFPQHATYTPGSIKPNHIDQDELDRAVESFYDTWKSTYLTQGCGEGRYYVYMTTATGGGENSISTSEGHGYGMVITALMAGYDPQAQEIFDGLYAFFKDHPSTRNPYLMAWNQVEGCENVEGKMTNSATDGDLDIAYALLLADKQWGSRGAINYHEEAVQVIDAILGHEVNPLTSTFLFGDWVVRGHPRYYGTRSSDLMFGHLRVYHRATGGDIWLEMVDVGYGLIETIQTGYSPETGLLPDFIQNVNTEPRPARPGLLEGENDGNYSYNACRDPFRIGTDSLLSGDPRGLAAMSRLSAWLRTATGGDPANIQSGYALDGTPLPDRDYTDMAFVAPFGVGAMVEADNQEWLNAVWDKVIDTPVGSYYGDTLKMQAIIVMSGNWWEP